MDDLKFVNETQLTKIMVGKIVECITYTIDTSNPDESLPDAIALKTFLEMFCGSVIKSAFHADEWLSNTNKAQILGKE